MPKQDSSTEYITIDETPTPEEEAMAFGSEADRREALANDRAEQDLHQRKVYAERAFGVVISWMTIIAIVIVIHFLMRTTGEPSFAPAEFIAIITTTTASAFGFWLLVGQGLFPKK